MGGEVGEEEEEGVNLHVITIACVRPYITGCRRPWLETDAQFTVRKDIRRKKEACWTSDKSVLGLDQDLGTKSYFLKFVTFFKKKKKKKKTQQDKAPIFFVFVFVFICLYALD